MEKREFQRVHTDGLEVQILKKNGSYHGEVVDISPSGISIHDLPEKIHTSEPNLTIIVSGHGETFKMHIRPRWSIVDEWRKTIGASISEPTQKWLSFVESLQDVNIADMHIQPFPMKPHVE